MQPHERRELLESIWYAAVDAVSGRQSVINALAAQPIDPPSIILAVGKAASGMAEGALTLFPNTPTLVVTKHDHATAFLQGCQSVEIIESAHPVPDDNSLLAGNALLQKMRDQLEQDHVLLLVSGGASSLAESLPDDMDLADLQRLNADMLAAGLTIGDMNARRKQCSQIKGGKLVGATRAKTTVLAISDVEGDEIATIGSGIGDPSLNASRANAHIIASNRIARARAAEVIAAHGIALKHNSETLYADVFALADQLGEQLQSATPGAYIWGGEPTVVLPEHPGRGGRNQALALALAKHLSNRPNISVIIAGTDGSDGPTQDAGGVVDSSTWDDRCEQALLQADAGSALQARNALFTSGPTHTNVMDIAIALVE
ncbi:MAG: DUF4147 domain-containing protein [Pseudomonadota bacterium]